MALNRNIGVSAPDLTDGVDGLSTGGLIERIDPGFAILMETGSYILSETGDKILLE